MGSQPVAVVSANEGASTLCRKRNLSAPSDSGIKKVKSDSQAAGGSSSERQEQEDKMWRQGRRRV